MVTINMLDTTSIKAKLFQHRTDTNRSQMILIELAQIIFYQPLYTILISQIIGVLVISVYFLDIVPRLELLSWAVYMIILSISFILTTYSYRRTPAEKRKLHHWIKLFPIAGVTLGFGWGSTSLWSNVMQDPGSMVFILLVAMGMTAAGIATLGPYFRSLVAFAGIITLSFTTVFLLYHGVMHQYLSIMIMLYLLVVLASGYHMRQAVRQSINLRLDKLELIEKLVEKNSQAEEARASAVQADISKSKFLAAASHDLRQPLHALGLFVDALDSRINYPEVRSIVDNIRISTDALSDLFNALLDISKLDAGVLEPKPIDFQLHPLLSRIQTDFTELANEKSIKLIVVDCCLVIHTDPSMLERILRNLVSNAIRYTQEGEIILDCQRRDGNVIIQVQDTGVGIPAHELDSIFEEFYQIENPERDRQKGLGLGLAIVKRLADLLACPLTVHSTPNKGSVFSISMPFVTTAIPTTNITPTFVEDIHGTRVLIIDDEALIRIGMRKVLEDWHCEVKEAENIEQALAIIGTDCAIDIILSDYRLRKNATGIDAIQQIHAACGKSIPAIILTGDTDPQRLREAKASGYKLLHKPVSPAKLRSLMSYLLDESSTV